MRCRGCRRRRRTRSASGSWRRWRAGRATRRFSKPSRGCRPHLPVRAYIVGDAVYQTEGSQYSLDELRQRARSLGVADRVGFTGFVHTPEATFRALHIVVHASTEPEPFGLVIAEAMACGRARRSSATPAARRRSSRPASTRSFMRRATPAIWRHKSPRWPAIRSCARESGARARRRPSESFDRATPRGRADSDLPIDDAA